ncbi:MAG TPA: prepilin-type N-terminal cleavage/methylation domain-containing protein [Candidatus Paceibacterota bacterium]|nr:prepilin-type N-terminal cleavage/methylation domain-containing protein [Candidatus Paceibacterota bacterium]
METSKEDFIFGTTSLKAPCGGVKQNMKRNKQSGFTLIEALVGIFVFAVVVSSILEAYYVLIGSARNSRLKVSATLLANEQIEIIRNLPYSSVGVVGGIPNGILDPEKTIIKDAATFIIKTTIRNKDDSFDGTLGGNPNDVAPADYKLAEVEVSCGTCKNFPPIILTTNVAPKSLETSSNNGALFVNVFDALGQPVPGAVVNIVNSYVTPQVNMSDVTGISGALQLVDVISSNQKYKISVSKDGYSSDMTYTPRLAANPNPTKPDATVASKQVTQISFSIDKLSALNVSTVTSTCTSTPNINFRLVGSKLIGTNPDVYKFSADYTTGADATKTIDNLEWDTYSVSIPNTLTSTHAMAGTLSMVPVSLLPDTTQDLKIIVAPKNLNGLLISLKDSGTGLSVSGAEVTLRKNGTSVVLTTGRGSKAQSDWQGGAGQADLYDETKYYSSSNVNTASSEGEIVLSSTLGEYETDGTLESSTFDTGSEGNFYNLNWLPIDEPTASGPDSVKFQIATNNDKSTWNYVGPDGTGNTYFTSSGEALGASHEGRRYIRYKVFLHTDDVASTPNISNVSFGFTSDCVPSGQVFFDGLSLGDYELDVVKEGYNSILALPVSVGGAWQEKVVLMSLK